MWRYIFVFAYVIAAVLANLESINGGSSEPNRVEDSRSANNDANTVKQFLDTDLKIDTNAEETDTIERRLENDEDGISSKIKFISSRRLPTKPIEKIIIENPPHLSIEVQNLDIGTKIVKRSEPKVTENINKWGNNEETFDDRVKRSYYIEEPLEVNDPYGHRRLHKNRRADAALSYERVRRHHSNGNQRSRTADPYYSDSSEDQVKPVSDVKPTERQAAEDKMVEDVVPEVPQVKAPIRTQEIERPARPYGLREPGYPRPRPTPAPYQPTPPHQGCQSCTHRHDPGLLPQSQEAQYYRRRQHPEVTRRQYTSRQTSDPIRSRSYQQTTYYPAASKMIISRRYSAGDLNSKRPKEIQGRLSEGSSSIGRNEYPLAH